MSQIAGPESKSSPKKIHLFARRFGNPQLLPSGAGTEVMPKTSQEMRLLWPLVHAASQRWIVFSGKAVPSGEK